jgi:hypothetical protein
MHVGIPDLIIEDKIVELKFTEKKMKFDRKHFEQLYRYYRSACKLNPEEKEKIKKLTTFSPITKEINELSIEEAVKK